MINWLHEVEQDLVVMPLSRMSGGRCAAFALRALMRGLPLLAAYTHPDNSEIDNSSSLWCWPVEEREMNLFAFLAACNVGYALHISNENNFEESKYHVGFDSQKRVSEISKVLTDARNNLSSSHYRVLGNCTGAVRSYFNTLFWWLSRRSRSTEAKISMGEEDREAANAAGNAYQAGDVAYGLSVAAIEKGLCIRQLMAEFVFDLAFLRENSGGSLLLQPLWSVSLQGEWLKLLESFKADLRRLNNSFEIWIDWYCDHAAGGAGGVDYFKMWNTIPDEIFTQGPRQVNAYLANLANGTAAYPLNRVRVFLLGDGNAGKTSLVRALHGEPVLEGKEEMTPGIDIREWPVSGTGIRAHFWDFGGQVMAHATHQLFLRSSCLYVVVVCARSEVNGTEQIEYWLEHVKAFGGGAPVILVANKSDQTALRFDMGTLEQKYPNLVGDFHLSCVQAQAQSKNQFDAFKSELCRQVALVGAHQTLFTAIQFRFLGRLRQVSQGAAFLHHSKFEELCGQYGIGALDVQNQAWMLDLLDKLGIVIHFPKLARMDDFVLNPRWLTYGIYTLMYAEKSQLSEADAIQILRDETLKDEFNNVLDYPKSKCCFILDAMEQFKLCFPLPNDKNTRIIPALLSAGLPTFQFDRRVGLAFEFTFKGFLPRHVMPELIVRRHEEIENGTVWQCGVLLIERNLEARALLQVDYHLRVLNIWVQGARAKEYLEVLRDEILKILGRLNLNYSELVTLPSVALIGQRPFGIGPEKASYRQIVCQARAGHWIIFSDSGSQYDLRKVLGIIMSEQEKIKIGVINNFYHDESVTIIEAQNTRNKTVNVVDSAIVGSVAVSDTIESSLNAQAESVKPITAA